MITGNSEWKQDLLNIIQTQITKINNESEYEFHSYIIDDNEQDYFYSHAQMVHLFLQQH